MEMRESAMAKNATIGNSNTLFLFVTGAGSCVRVPEIIRAFVSRDFTVYSVLTPSVANVTPPAPLMDVPGNHWIHAYRQPPLDVYPFGALLVAPCTFNSFNKIAHGVADNLAMAMIADGLGAGRPVIVAPSMNHGLWAHPQTEISRQRLRQWGCIIVPPAISDEPAPHGTVTMAATIEVVESVLQATEEDGR